MELSPSQPLMIRSARQVVSATGAAPSIDLVVIGGARVLIFGTTTILADCPAGP